MRLLFISRAYPPTLGGLENQNFSIHQALKNKLDVEAILNKKGKKNLPFFVILAAYKTLFGSGKADIVVLGDGVLAVIGWLIKVFKPEVSVVGIIHGLDITYSKPIYQLLWLKIFLPSLDAVIAVSEATKQAAIKKGIPGNIITVIPNAVSTQEHHTDPGLCSGLRLNFNAENKLVLLTIGRLVKRKGVDWFIRCVMPEIKDRCVYWIAGEGPERNAIEKSIEQNGLQKNVFYFGLVSEEMKLALFHSADCFVQPNIQVHGDMEGFGLAVLEANSNGLPVLAAELEGLKDAITDKQNGWFVEAENPNSYIQKIHEFVSGEIDLKFAGENAKTFVEERFSWEHIAARYISVFKSLAN